MCKFGQTEENLLVLFELNVKVNWSSALFFSGDLQMKSKELVLNQSIFNIICRQFRTSLLV